MEEEKLRTAARRRQESQLRLKAEMRKSEMRKAEMHKAENSQTTNTEPLKQFAAIAPRTPPPGDIFVQNPSLDPAARAKIRAQREARTQTQEAPSS